MAEAETSVASAHGGATRLLPLSMSALHLARKDGRTYSGAVQWRYLREYRPERPPFQLHGLAVSTGQASFVSDLLSTRAGCSLHLGRRRYQRPRSHRQCYKTAYRVR